MTNLGSTSLRLIASLPGEEPFHIVKCFIIMLFCSRVRENPGGNSSLANFWDAAEPTDFKPTRRYVATQNSLIVDLSLEIGSGKVQVDMTTLTM
jgi:hypothetical protein